VRLILGTLIRSIFWLVVVVHAGTALAQVSIGGPSSVRVEPGETRTLEYTITNRGDEEVQARVFYNDYAQRPSGTLEHIPANSLPRSLFRIAEFGPTEYILPPGASATVPLTVTVPEEPAAGYWGVIGVETPPPPVPGAGNEVVFNIRYAMVTALEIEGLARHGLAIDNISTIAGEDSQAVVITIRNSGNVYQRFDLTLDFAGPSGSAATLKESGVVLPGQTIDYAVSVPPDLPPGTYGVFAVIDYQRGMRAEAVTTVRVEAE
jgi:uncharacterized membrane protein